jgi:hypothetical protein
MINKLYSAEDGSKIDEKNFNKGAAKIFYTPILGANAFEEISYVVSKHISEAEKDPCILKLERNTNKFTLRSLSDIYKGQKTAPEEYLFDNFIVSNGLANDSSESFKGTAGLAYESTILDYKSASAGGDTLAKNIRNIITQLDINRDNNTLMLSAESTLVEMQKKFNKLYVEPFKALHKGTIAPTCDLTLLNSTVTIRPKVITETLPKDMAPVTVLGAVMNMLMASNNIVFRAPGSLHRRSGKFIDITTESSIAGTDQNKKLIGRWFVTKVTHIFSGSQYYNIIEAVKTYDIR